MSFNFIVCAPAVADGAQCRTGIPACPPAATDAGRMFAFPRDGQVSHVAGHRWMIGGTPILRAAAFGGGDYSAGIGGTSTDFCLTNYKHLFPSAPAEPLHVADRTAHDNMHYPPPAINLTLAANEQKQLHSL